MNKKIVMVGCLETGYNVIKNILEEGLVIDFFVLLTPEKAKQQKVAGFIGYEDLAQQYNVPIYYAEKYSLKGENDIKFFQEKNFDLLIQGGWQRLFPEDIIESLSIGAIGIHGSSEFLPRGRGRSPINWSLIEGKRRFILHYFLIKPGIDDGDIFHYELFEINQWDTCRTLYYKNSLLTAQVYLDWIPKLIKGDFEVLPQVGEPTYYAKRTEEDGKIHFENGVYKIYNLVRGVTHPYPGAFCFTPENEKMVIWKCVPFDSVITYYGKQHGEIIEVFHTGDFIINLKDGLLLVTEYYVNTKLTKGIILK